MKNIKSLTLSALLMGITVAYAGTTPSTVSSAPTVSPAPAVSSASTKAITAATPKTDTSLKIDKKEVAKDQSGTPMKGASKPSGNANHVKASTAATSKHASASTNHTAKTSKIKIG